MRPGKSQHFPSSTVAYQPTLSVKCQKDQCKRLSLALWWGCLVLNNTVFIVTIAEAPRSVFIQHIIIFSNMGTFVYFVSCRFVMFLIFATIFKRKGSVLRVVTVSQLQCQTWNNTVITWSAYLELCAFFFVNVGIYESCLTCLPEALTLCSWKLKWQSSSSPCGLGTNVSSWEKRLWTIIIFVQRQKTKDFFWQTMKKWFSNIVNLHPVTIKAIKYCGLYF